MPASTPYRAGLIAANVALLATWTWFAAASLGLPAALAAAVAFKALQIFMWRKLVANYTAPGSQPGRSVERISSLITRTDKRTAIREETTGLYYRWYFEMRLEQEALRCQRYGHSMAVLVVRAGAVNLSEFSLDGWQSPSAVAAERCIRAFRNIDLIAFLAPLEFAVCLIQCDGEGAEVALGRLQQELSEYRLDAGIAVYPEDGATPSTLLEQARLRSRAADQASPLDSNMERLVWPAA